MRKLVVLILIFSICLSLVACGSDETIANPSAEPEAEVTTITVVEKEISSVETVPIQEEAEEEKPIEVTIDEQVVYDDGKIKLTAKEIDFSDDHSINIKFLAENNSDANIAFVGDYFSINGITMYCGFYIEVAAGKKANDVLEIDKDDLSSVGIDNIATIVARDIFIYDDDASETIAYLDFEIATSIAEGYDQSVDESGQVVYDDNGIVIKYRGIVKDWADEEVLSFYIENNNSPAVSIYTDNVSINGFMVYGSMVAYAYPDCVTYEEMDFSSSDMEENGIESIEQVSFTLWAYDDESNEKVWESGEITVYAEVDKTQNTSKSNDMDDILQEFKSIMSYDNLSVTHSDGIITVEWYTEGLSSAVTKAKNGDVEKYNSWNQLSYGEAQQCLVLQKAFVSGGYDHISVDWKILDDTDTSNLLLRIIDGEIVYNAAE